MMIPCLRDEETMIIGNGELVLKKVGRNSANTIAYVVD